jgi:prephenate dehydrogenase
VLPPDVLITDVGSTKKEIYDRARLVLGEAAPKRFLAGHPMAGKERSGIENADADLFQGAVWLVTPQPGQELAGGRIGEYLDLVRSTGARVLPIDVEEHDRVCGWVSHLPQMTAIALAAAIEDEFGDDDSLRAIGGRALREMTRVAASPYSMWRDVALTNTENLAEALQRLEQRLAHIRENLKTAELREEFEKGNKFREKY